MIPVYITVRDRVSDLRKLVAWLEAAGHERITLLDCASTYEPLLDYLKATPHEVLWLGGNYGSRALWATGRVPDEPFVLSDPDLQPIEDCPHDAVEHLIELLGRHGVQKAGLGLYLEDVPTDMPSLAWERSLCASERLIEPGVYGSLVDTTFAVYTPGAPFSLDALRTGAPYLARHMPWYMRELDVEHLYYVEHAEHGPEGTNLTGPTQQ